MHAHIRPTPPDSVDPDARHLPGLRNFRLLRTPIHLTGNGHHAIDVAIQQAYQILSSHRLQTRLQRRQPQNQRIHLKNETDSQLFIRASDTYCSPYRTPQMPAFFCGKVIRAADPADVHAVFHVPSQPILNWTAETLLKFEKICNLRDTLKMATCRGS